MTTYLNAQTLLPIRDQGKWGYVNSEGAQVVPAIYDEAFAFEGSCAKVMKDSKAFLINTNGEERKIAGLDQFEIINNNYLLFRSGSSFGVANMDGQTIIPPEYENLRVLIQEPLLFDARIKGLHGIVDSTNKALTPFAFKGMVPYGSIIKLYNKDTFSFYSLLYEKYFAPRFLDVREEFGVHVAQDEQGWRFYDLKHDSARLPYYQNIEIIAKDYAEVIQKRDTSIIYLPEMKRIALNPQNFIMQTNIILINMEGTWSVYSEGNLLQDSIEQMYFIDQEHVKIIKNGKANVIYKDSLVFPWLYSDIRVMGSNLYLTTTSEGSGLHNRSSCLLPNEYDNIEIKGASIRALNRLKQLLIAEWVDGKVGEQILFTNHKTLFANTFSAGQVNIASLEDNRIWFRVLGKWGLKTSDEQVLQKPQFSAYQRITGTGLAIVYKPFYKNILQIDKLVTVGAGQICGIIREVDGSWLAPLKYAYIDSKSISDSSLNVIRAMGTSPFFETINKQTGDVKRYNAIYMDSFSNGRARIYIGGKMSSKPQEAFKTIGTLFGYMDYLGLMTGNRNRLERSLARRNPTNPRHLLYCVDGQWTYIDRNGDFLISPEKKAEDGIDFAERFIHNTSIVQRKQLYGVIDTSGNAIHPMSYLSMTRLKSDSVSLFKAASERASHSFYHQSGVALSPNSFDQAEPFNDEYTWVVQDSKYMIFGADGTFTEPIHQPSRVSSFNEHVSMVRMGRNPTLVDKQGNDIVKEKYKVMRPIQNGFAVAGRMVETGKGVQLRYTYVNQHGLEIVEPKYIKAFNFEGQMAEVMTSGNKHHLLNRSGQEITKSAFSEIDIVDEGRYAVVKKGNRKGLMNESGKLILPIKYRSIQVGDPYFSAIKGRSKLIVFEPDGSVRFTRKNVAGIGEFHEGLLEVSDSRTISFIDSNGNEVIPKYYRSATHFENGHAILNKGSVCMIVSNDGQELESFSGYIKEGIQEGYAIIRMSNGKSFYASTLSSDPFGLTFDYCKPFNNGLAMVKNEGKWGVINNRGASVLPCIYDRISIGKTGIVMASFDWQYGILNGKGESATPLAYDSIEQDIFTGIITLKDGSEPSYMSQNGLWIWKSSGSNGLAQN
jgi:hypothetical protein